MSNPRNRRYWLRLIRLFVVALAGALVILPTALGVMSAWGLTHPPCYMGATAAEHGFERYEEVTFPSTRNITQQGYFFPGDNGATIILAPAYGNGRGGEPHYANMFQEAGFNVLTLNSRVCTRRGLHSLGYQEVEDIEAAYAYLNTRPDVAPDQISLHGFSSAGATSLMAAARIPQIRSVTAEGGYHDYAAMMGLNSSLNFFDRLYTLGAAATYRFITGDDIAVLNPLQAIGQLGSRPVLLTYGSEEVSLSGAYEMLEHALQSGVDAELWVVEGAGHGNYLTIAGREYVERIVGFHSRVLLGEDR